MHRPGALPSLHHLLPMQTLQGRGRHLRSLSAPRQHGVRVIDGDTIVVQVKGTRRLSG